MILINYVFGVINDVIVVFCIYGFYEFDIGNICCVCVV